VVGRNRCQPWSVARDVVPMEVSPRARARSGLFQRNINGGTVACRQLECVVFLGQGEFFFP